MTSQRIVGRDADQASTYQTAPHILSPTTSVPLSRDERFMLRALELAQMAEGRTHPNPAVGCVIVHGDTIVAEGFTSPVGGPHAEVAALKNLKIPGADCEMYVSLEPCSHFNRTPPCTQAVIASGIRRVVIGTIDTNPKVSGRGVAMLREAGIEVVCDVLEAESRRLNAPFFKHIATGLPYVVAKYAMSLDGKIATRNADSAWITGESARAHVHKLRNTYDAIMVGSGTLKADNPRLTCRMPDGRDPVRVVLDTRLESSPESRVFNLPDSTASTILMTGDNVSAKQRAVYERDNVEIEPVALDEDGRLDPRAMLEILGNRGLLSVLVEGGGTLLGTLFDRRLVDRVYAYIAPKIIGGQQAPAPISGLGIAHMNDAFTLEHTEIFSFEPDILICGDIPDAFRDLTPRKAP